MISAGGPTDYYAMQAVIRQEHRYRVGARPQLVRRRLSGREPISNLAHESSPARATRGQAEARPSRACFIASTWYILAGGSAHARAQARIDLRARLLYPGMRFLAIKWAKVESIGSYLVLRSRSDPRRHVENRKNLLCGRSVDLGVWCGSDRPRAINRWAENRREWLEQFLSLANRISARDCTRHLLMALQPKSSRIAFKTGSPT